MDLVGSPGNTGHPGVHRSWRRASARFVELVAAPAVRMAPDRLLASARSSGAVPDPVRRTRATPGGPFAIPPSHVGPHGRSYSRTLGRYDAGGARAIPRTDAPAVRVRTCERNRREFGRLAHYPAVLARFSRSS